MAATALLFGPQVFLAYAMKALPFQTKFFTETDGIFVCMMPPAFMNARLAGADASIAWLVQAPVTVIGIAFALWGLVEHRRSSPAQRRARHWHLSRLALSLRIRHDGIRAGPRRPLEPG